MDSSLTLLAQNLSAHSPTHLRRLEFLVNTSPLVLYTCEAGGDYRATFVSEGVKALWGYEREEFLADSKFWADRLHPDDVARVFAHLEHLTHAGDHHLEYRFRNKSGEYRWVRDELRLLRDSAGNALEIVGHCFDITERKLAEAALRESEARLQLIFNGTTDLQVLFRVAPGNGFITETLNRAVIENFQSNTGKDMRDFLGRSFEEILAATGLKPEQIEHRRTLYLRAVQERTTVRFETPQTPLRDAAEVEVSPVVDQDGRCTHVLWSARNVSDRVKAASALLASEERYALATEATLDGIFDWNLATGDSHLSPRLKEILGFRDDELPNDFSAFFSRVHSEDLNWLSQLVVRLNADRTLEKFDHEVRLRRKDGSYCWVVSRGQVVRDALGQPTRFIGAIRDITERKQAEDASAFLAAIVQSSDDSIVGSNLDGTILSWNASSERYWGYSAEEAIGQSNSILFPPDRQNEYADRIAKIRRGQPAERYETLRRRKNGTLVPVSVILSPVKDARGTLLGFAAIYSDMTGRYEAEARLL
ncbi:MAG TPA: PAS domain S-box protein, partial [Bryobacteraceae bacterium]|nr:PAS domain S-box protein [Bryobacteraceae bacterium]